MSARCRPLLLLLVLVLLGGARGAAAGEPEVTVAEVEFSGLRRITAETLLALSPLQQGVRVARGELPGLARETIKRIFATGYFSDVAVFSRDDDEGLVITVRVEEKYVIRKIHLVGNDKIEAEDIVKTYSVKEGRFLDPEKLVATLRSIEELYQDKGFFLAEASYEVARDQQTRTASVTLTVKEQAEIGVSSVIFVGNEQVSDSDLKSIMMTREKSYLSFMEKSGLFLRYFFQLERAEEGAVPEPTFADSLEASQFESWSAHQDVDLQRLKWFYMTKGFVEVKLGQPRIALTPDRESIVVTIDVEEGQPFDVGRVEITSDDPDGLLLDVEELSTDLKLKTGERFDAQNVMADTDRLSKEYMNKGYAFVSVSNSHFLNREKRTLDLSYVIQKGLPTFVANIVVVGNRTTADKVVRREMKIHEGELYHQGMVDRSKALIYRLGFFEEVEISHRPTVAPPVVRPANDTRGEVEFVELVVSVKEKDTGIFQVGAGFSSLESYILQARISKNNFLGRGQTVSVQALVSSLRSIYMLSFVEPYFLDTNWNFSFDLYDTATDYEAFTTEALGGNLSWGYRFWDDYYAYLTYKIERMKTQLGGRLGYGGIPIDRLEQDGVTSSLRLSLAWDTRNNRIMPTEGFYNSASIEWATPWLGGDSDFYRSTLNSRWYFPLFWNLILRLNGTLGHVATTSSEPIPIFERYYVGGIFSVRGFQRNSLSPTIPAAAEKDPSASLVPFPLGGNKQLIFNAEIELPIYRPMGIVAVLFFDAGNAFAEEESLDLSQLRTSAGLGFRWWSPMGPLRFEWGFPLKPQEGEEPMVFEFTIGSAF